MTSFITVSLLRGYILSLITVQESGTYKSPSCIKKELNSAGRTVATFMEIKTKIQPQLCSQPELIIPHASPDFSTLTRPWLS